MNMGRFALPIVACTAWFAGCGTPPPVTYQVRALEAAVQKASVALKLSEVQYQRDEQLRRDGFLSPAGLDQARTARQRDAAELEQASAQLTLAKQSIGRPAELDSARAEAGAAEAVVAQAAWKVGQRTQRAPSAALVHETCFVPGEWVPAGKPVVSLLPPANVKVRFFVPETIVGSLRLGSPVRIACDGCGRRRCCRWTTVPTRGRSSRRWRTPVTSGSSGWCARSPKPRSCWNVARCRSS